MAHFVASTATAGPTPESHTGLNYQYSAYSLAETASGSVSISMCALPAGARVADAVVSWDNDAMGAGAAPGTVAVQVRTGGVIMATIIQSASLNATGLLARFNPTHEAIGYRATASSNVFVVVTNGASTLTAVTEFRLQLSYDCQKSGD